jgi:hypothetical protein
VKKLLLNHHCQPHWASSWECRHCHQSGDPIRLLFPELRREHNIVVLTYPVICQCGRRGSLRVELPILLFGIVLARIVLMETKCGRYRGEIDLKPGETRAFRQYAADFEQALVEFAEQALGFPRGESKSRGLDGDRWAGLGDPERAKFDMSVAEWQEFLRRLGADEPSMQEGQDGQADDDG